jgi:hypothetical protein
LRHQQTYQIASINAFKTTRGETQQIEPAKSQKLKYNVNGHSKQQEGKTQQIEPAKNQKLKYNVNGRLSFKDCKEKLKQLNTMYIIGTKAQLLVRRLVKEPKLLVVLQTRDTFCIQPHLKVTWHISFLRHQQTYQIASINAFKTTREETQQIEPAKSQKLKYNVNGHSKQQEGKTQQIEPAKSQKLKYNINGRLSFKDCKGKLKQLNTMYIIGTKAQLPR